MRTFTPNNLALLILLSTTPITSVLSQPIPRGTVRQDACLSPFPADTSLANRLDAIARQEACAQARDSIESKDQPHHQFEEGLEIHFMNNNNNNNNNNINNNDRSNKHDSSANSNFFNDRYLSSHGTLFKRDAAANVNANVIANVIADVQGREELVFTSSQEKVDAQVERRVGKGRVPVAAGGGAGMGNEPSPLLKGFGDKRPRWGKGPVRGGSRRKGGGKS